MTTIAAIGEVMVELSPFPTTDNSDRDIMSLSFAGDTYNTSVYMARLGVETGYITQLGTDPYSQQIMHRMTREAIDTKMIKQLPGRSPGLYIIRNTPDGERDFFYWRNESPARELFATQADADVLFTQLINYDYVYLSGITLAIITEQARTHLYQMLNKLRKNNVKVAFDSNYRPRLWCNQTEAQETMLAILQHTDIALLTLDDEQLLWGYTSIEDCKARYAKFNLDELVLKRGAEDVIVITAREELHLPVPLVKNVIDTTGAGDTFNAGYLAGRLMNKSLTASVKQGIDCAGIIIRHRGAIIDRELFANERKSLLI